MKNIPVRKGFGVSKKKGMGKIDYKELQTLIEKRYKDLCLKYGLAKAGDIMFPAIKKKGNGKK